MKYKIGDKVRIIKPEGWTSNWPFEMDDTVGDEAVLDFFDVETSPKHPWVINAWWYSEDCLELVEHLIDPYDYAMGIV